MLVSWVGSSPDDSGGVSWCSLRRPGFVPKAARGWYTHTPMPLTVSGLSESGSVGGCVCEPSEAQALGCSWRIMGELRGKRMFPAGTVAFGSGRCSCWRHLVLMTDA